jgi:hypothetical protein
MNGNDFIVFGDITELFAFNEGSLDYNDAPLEGVLSRHSSGEVFAFRCIELVPGFVWHWLLIKTSGNESKVFELARINPPQAVLSILEDHRGCRKLHCVVIYEDETKERIAALLDQFGS